MTNKAEYDKDSERIASLETHRLYTATQQDITRLEGKIDTSVETMKMFINDAVSQTEIKTLKRFVTFWITIAGIVVSLLTSTISFLANKLLSN